MRRLAAFGAARASDASLLEKTNTGAAITLAAGALALLLATSELREYANPAIEQNMDVDAKRGELMRVQFNLTFHHMPCHVMHVDTADASGEHASDAAPLHLKPAAGAGGGGSTRVRGGELHKTRLSPAGDTLGVEYHHPSPDHVRVHGFTLARPSVDAAALDAAFDAGEGCRLSGWFLIQKVAGNLRFTPHMEDYLASRAARTEVADALRKQLDAAVAAGGAASAIPHILRLAPDFSRLNISHTVHTLSFGAGVHVPGGLSEPLNGHREQLTDTTGTLRYYVTVVATEIPPSAAFGARSLPARTYQYSLTRAFIPLAHRPAMPAVLLMYDTSPLLLRSSVEPRSLSHLVGRLVAVLGGVMALARLAAAAAGAVGGRGVGGGGGSGGLASAGSGGPGFVGGGYGGGGGRGGLAGGGVGGPGFAGGGFAGGAGYAGGGSGLAAGGAGGGYTGGTAGGGYAGGTAGGSYAGSTAGGTVGGAAVPGWG